MDYYYIDAYMLNNNSDSWVVYIGSDIGELKTMYHLHNQAAKEQSILNPHQPYSVMANEWITDRQISHALYMGEDGEFYKDKKMEAELETGRVEGKDFILIPE